MMRTCIVKMKQKLDIECSVDLIKPLRLSGYVHTRPPCSDIPAYHKYHNSQAWIMKYFSLVLNSLFNNLKSYCLPWNLLSNWKWIGEKNLDLW